MKLVKLASLLTLVFMVGCQTSQKEVVKNATNDGLVREDKGPDLKAAAEKRLALGLGYIKKGLLERAKKNLLIAEEHAPNMPDVMYGLGYYYQKVLELDTADSYYKKALAAEPNNPDYLNAYGAFLCTAKGDYNGSIKYFLEAVDQTEYTSVGESYENAGFCSLDGGNFELAENYFKKALVFNPKLSKPLYGLALMFFEAGEYNKAESMLLRFEGKTRVTPQSLLLGYKIGRRLNDRFSMESYGEKLMQLYPGSEQARVFQRMAGQILN